MKTNLSINNLSGNEFSFLNEHPLRILVSPLNQIFDVPAGHSVYLEDKLIYRVNIIEDDHYAFNAWDMAVEQTVRAGDETANRVVVSYLPWIQKEKEAYLKLIDVDAEAARGKYITLGSGQAMTYQEKRLEAQQVVDNPMIDPQLVPHVSLPAQRHGISLLEEAQIILAVAQPWKVISAVLDDKRLAAKEAIAEVDTIAGIHEIYQAINWDDIA